LEQESPENDVFVVPFFLKGKIVSNQMCKILIHLLHADPIHRYQNLDEVKQDMLKLRKNIFETPILMRQVLGHPVLPGEGLNRVSEAEVQELVVDFRMSNPRNFKKRQDIPVDFDVINSFSLKYLAKFVTEYDIFQLCIYGGALPIRSIKTN